MFSTLIQTIFESTAPVFSDVGGCRSKHNLNYVLARIVRILAQEQVRVVVSGDGNLEPVFMNAQPEWSEVNC